MTDFFPLQLLLATFAGWVNHEQTKIVDYLFEENRPCPVPISEHPDLVDQNPARTSGCPIR